MGTLSLLQFVVLQIKYTKYRHEKFNLFSETIV